MRLATIIVCLSANCLTVPALAQGEAGSAKDQARELAIAAGEDLDAGRHREALDRATRAEALYHAPTHLQMQGEALEGLGRLVEAMAVYERLASEALPTGSSGAFIAARNFGERRLRALTSSVPSLLVKVRTTASDPEVRIDGEVVNPDDGARRVDPGEHEIVVTAAGYATVSRTLALSEGDGVEVVEVTLAEQTDPQPPDGVPDAVEGSFPIWPGALLAGVGGAGLIAGVITGVLSLEQVAELDERCPDKRCPPGEQGSIADVERLGNASTGLLVAGGVVAAVGVSLIIVSATAGEESTSIRLGPGTLQLHGRF